MLSQITEWVIRVVESLGYGGVAFLVMFENVFPPIPSEVVLALAGFVASRGDASLLGMIVASTVGSLLGAYILYGVGAVVGAERLQALVRRYGWWVRITETDLETAHRWFDRWSTTAVLIGRCVPLVRSLISIPAGVARMPFLSFTLYTTAGSLVWNAIFVTAGYLLGERWETVLGYADVLQKLTLATIGLGLLVLAYFLVRRRFA